MPPDFPTLQAALVVAGMLNAAGVGALVRWVFRVNERLTRIETCLELTPTFRMPRAREADT